MLRGASFPFDSVVIDRASPLSLQRQLYAILRADILKGRLANGFTLPPSRALAKQLGIGRNTVIAVYDQLLAEGFVDARQGSGTFEESAHVRCRSRGNRCPREGDHHQRALGVIIGPGLAGRFAGARRRYVAL